MFYTQFLKLCEIKGVKPTPLIKRLGLSPGNLKRWENGSTVNSDILILLSEHFGVSVDYLLTGKEIRSQSISLTDDEQELLTYYKKLSDIDKGRLIERAETMSENKQDKPLQQTYIATARMVSRSTDNQPPEEVTADFSDVINAPDATDDY